jgi:hypothetical protein
MLTLPAILISYRSSSITSEQWVAILFFCNMQTCLTQCIFRPTSRRERLRKHTKGDRRGGGSYEADIVKPLLHQTITTNMFGAKPTC